MVHDRLCGAKRSHFSQTPADEGFPGGSVVKNLPANAGDKGSTPGLGRTKNKSSKFKDTERGHVVASFTIYHRFTSFTT